MTDTIEKLAVFDDRIVQSRPKYAVEKGALSLTNSPFAAISATSSQHTYNVTVPSEMVYVDRAIDWTSTCALQFVATPNGGAPAVNVPVVVFGRDCALSAFPLHSLAQTITATINDTTTTMNTSDVLYEVLRLTDMKKNRLQRTCPTYLDTYKSYTDAQGTTRNPIGSYDISTSRDEVPNGAWWNLQFTTPTGTTLTGNGTYVSSLTGAPVTVTYVNGIPVGDGATTAFPIYIKFTSTEKVVLSPFVFSDVHENDTGLFGIQNMQFVMNMASPSQTAVSGRVLRCNNSSVTLSSVGYNSSISGNNGSPFSNSILNVQFLTPSLDIPLPPKSVVPYMEFPRYISNVSFSTAVGVDQSQSGVQSQTITLPQIPDLMIIYAKPTAYASTDADYYLPITQLSVNFDNFAGLLSSHTDRQLYTMSVNNGLEMDYDQWSGYGKSASGGSTSTPPTTTFKRLTGGFLVLKPSKDITLQTGQAPSLVGNFTFQFTCTVQNTSGGALNGLNLYVITANSGFFESMKGSSRIVKGVLTEADIINAPLAPSGTRAGVQRLVGGAGLFGSLGNVLSRVKDFASPIYRTLKPMLPPTAQMIGDAVGLGRAGMSGGRPSGRSGGASAKLSQRLM